MTSFSPIPSRVIAALLGTFLAGEAPRVAAQAQPATPSPKKSVYGKLERVDKSLNGIIMRSDEGKRLAWQFDRAVIAELQRFKPGDRMIVIYRQTSPNEKRVTAVAFPDPASTPTYVNLTGSRVVLRSGPMVDGVCGRPDAAPVQEFTIPSGGRAEATDACWCCAAAEDSCTPANKTGPGQAVLVHCFE